MSRPIFSLLLLLASAAGALAQENAETEAPDRLRLHKAAEKGDLEEVRYCVETLKMPINEEADFFVRETPLMYAARSGNLELVKYMVAQGAEPGACTDCDEGLESVAMYALRSKNVEMLRYFVEELNQEPDSFYNSPLIYAIEGKNAEMVRYVIERWPNTPLYQEDAMESAVLPWGFEAWTRELKRTGEDSATFSRKLSNNAGNPEIVDILLEHGVPVKIRHLYWAVRAQQPEMVRSLLKALDWQWVSDIRSYNSWCRLACETGNPAVLEPFREWEDAVAQKFKDLELDDELGDEGFAIDPTRFRPFDPRYSSRSKSLSSYPRFAPYSGCDLKTRVWLTFSRSDCSRVMISWCSPWETAAVLHYGPDRTCAQTVACDEITRLHRVEIEIPPGQERMSYQVESRDAEGAVSKTPVFTFKTCQGCDELRICVMSPDEIQNILPGLAELHDAHLILTTSPTRRWLVETFFQRKENGDRIGPEEHFFPVGEHSGDYPWRQRALATTILMPTLTEADRRSHPPEVPFKRVAEYHTLPWDAAATAYLSVFSLPEPGYRWYLDLPGFFTRIVSLDLDRTPHDLYCDDGELRWFREQMSTCKDRRFTLTLHSKFVSFRNQDSRWRELFGRGTCTFCSGFMGERVECSRGGGTHYSTCTMRWPFSPAPNPCWSSANPPPVSDKSNFMVLRIPRDGPMTATMYEMFFNGYDIIYSGKIVDQKVFTPSRLNFSF